MTKAFSLAVRPSCHWLARLSLWLLNQTDHLCALGLRGIFEWSNSCAAFITNCSFFGCCFPNFNDSFSNRNTVAPRVRVPLVFCVLFRTCKIPVNHRLVHAFSFRFGSVPFIIHNAIKLPNPLGLCNGKRMAGVYFFCMLEPRKEQAGCRSVS